MTGPADRPRTVTVVVREPLTEAEILRVEVPAAALGELAEGRCYRAEAGGAVVSLGVAATPSLAAAAGACRELVIHAHKEDLPVLTWACIEAGSLDDAHVHVAPTAARAAVMHAERYCGPDDDEHSSSMDECVDVVVLDPRTGRVSVHRVLQGYFPLRRIADPGEVWEEDYGDLPDATDGDREALEACAEEMAAAAAESGRR